MSRLLVEIQGLKDRKCIIEDNINMIVYRMKELNIPTITDDDIKDITTCLLEQRKDSSKFPNVIVFLGRKNLPTSIDEFMKQYKDREKK